MTTATTADAPDAVAESQIAAIAAMTELEARVGAMNEYERHVFTMGFIAGTMHGLDMARKTLKAET